MKKTDRKPYFTDVTDEKDFMEASWGSEFGDHHGSYSKEYVSAGWNNKVMEEMILQEVTVDEP